MSTTTTTPINISNMEKITTRTIGLDLVIGKPSAQKTVRSSNYKHLQGTVDTDSIRVAKKLLESPEFKKINKLDSQMGGWLRKVALPSFLRRGVYILPIKLVDSTDDVLTSYRTERGEAVDELLAVYPALIEQDRDKLGPEFNAEDYPRPEILKASFYVSSRYVSLETPDKLEDISASIFKREKDRVSQMWDSATDNIRNLLRYTFQELLDNMVKAIRPAEEGEKKRFRASTANNLLEFLATFDPRNITNDDELLNIVNKCKDILGSGNPELLRKNEELRTQTYAALSDIKVQIDAMAVVKPKRKITFEEDSTNAC